MSATDTLKKPFSLALMDNELDLAPAELIKYEELYKKALMILRSQGKTLSMGLLNISRVVWTKHESMPTACIVLKGARPKIYVNVDFIDELMNKSEHKHEKHLILAGILAHELCHYIFRHGAITQEKRLKYAKLRNMVYDIFINHFLKKLNLHQFAEIYYPSEEEETKAFFLNPSVKNLSTKHAAFYKKVNDIQASLTDIENYLIKNMTDEELENLKAKFIFVGSHDASEEDGEESSEGEVGEVGEIKEEDSLSPDSKEELEEIIREILTKKEANSDNFNKASSKFGDLFEEGLKVEKKKDEQFEDFSKRALVTSLRGQVLASIGRFKGPTTQTTHRPQNNRSKLALAAAGAMPYWWNKSIKVDFGTVRMYVDMSGSMTGLKELVASIILGLERSWNVELFLFTTKVTAITKHDLRDGKFRSGGTDFNCIFKHLTEEECSPKKVLIITDGYDTGLNETSKNYLDQSKLELYAVYTKNHCLACLDAYTKDKWILDF